MQPPAKIAASSRGSVPGTAGHSARARAYLRVFAPSGVPVKRPRASADMGRTALTVNPRPPLTRLSTPRCLVLLGVALLALHLADDAFLSGHDAFTQGLKTWFQPATFALSGVAVLVRACRVASGERTPWLLLGSGLTLYASGSVYYNLASANGPAPAFPSTADALWLALYPLVYASLALLLRRHVRGTRAAVWLDGLIGGGVV